jgi:hypothetical protein
MDQAQAVCAGAQPFAVQDTADPEQLVAPLLAFDGG